MAMSKGLFQCPCWESQQNAHKNPIYIGICKRWLSVCPSIGNGGGIRTDLLADTFWTHSVQISGLHRKNVNTLIQRFAPTRPEELTFDQCARMLNYTESVECVFNKIAVNGRITVLALSTALVQSGFNIISGGCGSSNLEQKVAAEIIKIYSDGNALTFQQFLNLRLHWDHYISQWEKVMMPGNHHMNPHQLEEILESFQQGLTNRTVRINKVFSKQTLAKLMNRHSNRQLVGTFEQFCMMMDFVHHHEELFSNADANSNGVLGKSEFSNVCHRIGIPVAPALKLWDENNSATIEFDEFLLMMLDLNIAPTSAVRKAMYGNAIILMKGGF